MCQLKNIKGKQMIKINSLTIENVKRVKAVSMEIGDGLTVIGGKNSQGKTSVLDAIMWTLGGGSFRPSHAEREGALTPPKTSITLSNGLIVERTGKNSTLKVTDPEGKKYGQALLDSFISAFALDLPRFMHATDKEKANVLLQILGIGDYLKELEGKYKQAYNRRLEIGRIRDRKKAAAAEMPYYPNCPKEPVSALELINQQQAILLRNEENRNKRKHLSDMRSKKAVVEDEIRHLTKKLEELNEDLKSLINDISIAQANVETLKDESTAELEKNLAEIDTLNQKIRTNAKKEAAEMEADQLGDEYDALSDTLQELRKKKVDCLQHSKLPLPELSVENGVLTYQGQPWDCMSGSEQLKVAAAIVRQMNPECGFVLMDKLEQMDMDTLSDFGAWLEKEGLQCIATRVSTGDECSIIIEDGMVKGNRDKVEEKAPAYVKGVF